MNEEKGTEMQEIVTGIGTKTEIETGCLFVVSCKSLLLFMFLLIIKCYSRQKRSRSRERDHDRSRKAGTSGEKRASKSPERKEDVKPVLKSEAELKEEAAAAAVVAKVLNNFFKNYSGSDNL